MAYNNNTGRQEFTATSGQTVFDFNFKIFAETDVKVYQNSTLLTITTHYTVTIDGDDGGTVTLVTGAATNDAIILKRDLPVTRTTDYQSGGDLLEDTLDDDQDYQTYLLADKDMELSHYLKVSDTISGFDNEISTPLPLQVLRFNADASKIETQTIGGDEVYLNIANIDTIAELPAAPTIETYNVRGYAAAGDGGGGIFNYDATVNRSSANGGTIIDATGTGVGSGCWIRQYSGAINALWFGATGDGGDSSSALDLFFAVSGSKKVSGGDFVGTLTDVDNFLDSLNDLTIDGGSTLTITLPSGETTVTNTTEIKGVGLENLLVLGAAYSTETITAIGISSVGAGNHTQTITTSSPIGASVDDFVIVKNTTGTGSHYTLNGVWKVTGVSGNDVTVKNTCQKATIGTFTVTGGTLLLIPTVLKYEGKSGIQAYTNAGHWGRMVLSGDGLGSGDISGVRVTEGGFIKIAASTNYPMGVHGFLEHGINIATMGGAAVFDSFSCANGNNGLYTLDTADVVATRIVCNGNTSSGIVASVNTSMGASQSKACGNGQSGITSSGESVIAAGTAQVFDNAVTGIRALSNSTILASGSFVGDNPTHVRADDYAYVDDTSITNVTDEGAFNRYTTNNGKVGMRQNILAEYGDGSGTTPYAAASNLIIDSDSAAGAGLSINTLEAEYGYIVLGNPTSGSECLLRYRGTSNALDFFTQGSIVFSINASNHLTPAVDNTQDLGSSSKRMRTIYAGTGTINTSDEREKQQINDLTVAEKNVAIKLKSAIKTFKFNDAVELKGENARIHTGVIAQEVIDIFASEGLDATRYAILCYDEWEAQPEERDEEGNILNKDMEAGNRYGIRYEEMLAFIISAM